MEFLGDSKVVTNWMRGIWEAKFVPYRARVETLQTQWASFCNRCSIMPPRDHLDFHRHIFRELNSTADSKANLGRTSGSMSWCSSSLPRSFSYVRTYCDGSFKDGVCGAGVVVYVASKPGPEDDNWTQIAWLSFPVVGASITAAELEAAACAQAFVQHLIGNPSSWRSFPDHWLSQAY